MFQSTRPRGARRRQAKRIAKEDVSIHAPTWSATARVAIDLYEPKVSIHAPTWSATDTRYWINLTRGFNPRAHVERDLDKFFDRQAEEVSIHAPTWSATEGRSCGARWTGFNPRAHVERDAKGECPDTTPEFQSTRPRGARRAIDTFHER